jgi:hypothetical protein
VLKSQARTPKYISVGRVLKKIGKKIWNRAFTPIANLQILLWFSKLLEKWGFSCTVKTWLRNVKHWQLNGDHTQGNTSWLHLMTCEATTHAVIPTDRHIPRPLCYSASWYYMRLAVRTKRDYRKWNKKRTINSEEWCLLGCYAVWLL